MDADDRDTPDDESEPEPISRRIPTRPRGHIHACTNHCGVELHCPEDDQCRVIDTARSPWMCPSCLDHIDELAIQELARKLARINARERRRSHGR